VDIQVQPGKRDERGQRDGGPSESAVRQGQNRCAHRRGERMSGREGVIRRIGDQKLHAGIQPAGTRTGDPVFQKDISRENAERQPREQEPPVFAVFLRADQHKRSRDPDRAAAA